LRHTLILAERPGGAGGVSVLMAAYPPPAARRLRVYAFDPQTASTLGSIGYAFATIALPWEEAWEDPLQIGPVNEYLEIVDVDPASGQFYAPLDLNDPHLLAQDGLTPSEGNPQFHQQMVFAVAMKVIRLFERALGRRVIWAPWWNAKENRYEPVKRLRIYPHALREANAYYSREKRALLFGYFRAAEASAGANWIFTALSHDIIAHETTHAILDGLHRRYAEATSIDSLAFHEAFADIVALFSHFTLYEAVYAHVQEWGGALDRESLLSGLDRGAILVAAVFDAFLTIFKTRTDDLLRIGGVTRGEGKRINPDLAVRLTKEAGKCADHVLRMCIRALDYLPPVDVRFGEFLRAIITADFDLVPNDALNYRVAFAEAFRRRGIMADDCLSMSPENLLWESAEEIFGANLFRRDELEELEVDLVPHYSRDDTIRVSEANRHNIWAWLILKDPDRSALDRKWQQALGVFLTPPKRPMRSINGADDEMKVEVHSVRTTRRSGPDGQDVRQLVIEVAQRRWGFFDADRQARIDAGKEKRPSVPDFMFRGGATLIVDLRENKLRYVMLKRIDDHARLDEQRELLGQPDGFGFTYIPTEKRAAKEPFAMVHRGQ
jgi:hypothetical protein